MTIIFFGTSNVALPVMEVLHKNHKIAAVITTPDAKVGPKQILQESPVSVLAQELGLHLFKPHTIKNNPELELSLTSFNANIFIVVSYGKILPESIINLPKNKTLNIHFSWLPEFRGASPIQAALLAGKKETGVSIFVLDKYMDHGPILTQERLTVDDDDTYITLADKASHKAGPLLLNTLSAIEQNTITPQEQDHSKATYCGLITKQDGRINWQKTSNDIYNQFRAFYPWPGIWTRWNNRVLKILDCHPINQPVSVSPANPPGTVIASGQVLCGQNTCLQITSLQLAGKSQVSMQNFLHGNQSFIGSQLSTYL